jgi:hypothetical protein
VLETAAVLDIKRVQLYFDSSYVNSWLGLGQRYNTFLQNVRSDLLMKTNTIVFRSAIIQSGGNLLIFA